VRLLPDARICAIEIGCHLATRVQQREHVGSRER
jgi:hypothetical protein